MKRVTFTILCTIMLAVTGPARLESVPAEIDRSQLKSYRMNYVPGEVLVQYRPSVSVGYAAMNVSSKNHAFVKALPRFSKRKGPMAVVRLRARTTVEEAIEHFKNDPDVEYAQPNYVYRVNAAPGDPRYGQLWGLKNTNQAIAGGTYAISNPPGSTHVGKDIDAELAWDVITDCSAVTVAVIDSGVNHNHEDLAENMVNESYSCPGGTGTYGCDFVGAGDNDSMDLNGHGTHVAGTIGAVGNNGKGSTGVCWKAKILAVRVLDAAGIGTTEDIVEGLVFAVGQDAGQGKAKVVNMSLGGGQSDTAFYNAITEARNNGVVVVVAAGNGDASGNGYQITGSAPSYPCQYDQDNIICVAAADQRYERASFSNFSTTHVDIAAPGTNILSTFAGDQTIVSGAGAMENWSFAGSGTSWGKRDCSVGGAMWPMLLLPDDCETVLDGTSTSGYADNTNSTVYKIFDIPGSIDSVYADFILLMGLESENDTLYGYHDAIEGDPVPSGTLFLSMSGYGGFVFQTELSKCNGASKCSVGFNVVTNSSVSGSGVGVADLLLVGMDVDVTNRYAIQNGTSMAAPHVAGVAAMVRARNPGYSYADTINAIIEGDEYSSSYYTKSRGTLNAFGALKYIPQTEGVTVNTP